MKPLADRLSLILVPQSAEARSVRQGLRAFSNAPPLLAIPAGPEPAQRFLQQRLADASLFSQSHPSSPTVLLLGLCGSLAPNLRVGDAILYDACLSASVDGQHSEKPEACDPGLTQTLAQGLGDCVQLGTGLTCDRVLCTAQAKQQWGQRTGALVVDMEGWPLLQLLNHAGIATAILRVVSDDCDRDLPDISQAIDAAGNLRPLALTRAMVAQPRAATRLIRGSLTGLKRLQQLAALLCTAPNSVQDVG